LGGRGALKIMKNQIKTIVVALIWGTAIFANANSLPVKPTIKTFALSVYKINGESSYNIFVNKLEGSILKITLKDAKNDIFYEQFLSKKETKFRTKLNVSNLESGNYFLELTEGGNVEIKAIEISNIEKKGKTFETSIIQITGSSILKVNIDKIEGVKVYIYLRDDANNIILGEVLEKTQLNYRVNYNLSKLEKGTYMLEITDGACREEKSVEVIK
jgi:myo-inositol-hexaphosphate 3-phosphohydrolase